MSSWYSPKPVMLMPHPVRDDLRQAARSHPFWSGQLPSPAFIVPYRFTFNGFSRPWWTAKLFGDPFGKHAGSGMGHDWLYRNQPPGVTRKMADKAMREWMAFEGAGRIKRYAAYWAVRRKGQARWDMYRERLGR